MKSVELYRHLRSGLAEWFRDHGFKRAARTQLGWNADAVFVWFQCDERGWDKYAGSSVFVNFQVGAVPEPWSAPIERLQHFLTAGELEVMRDLQNEVIRKLRTPPPEYIEVLRAAFSKYANGDSMLDAVLAQFRPVEQPYRSHQDVSLRYFEARDIQNWVSFLIGVLPRIVDELRQQTGGPPDDSA